MDEGLLKTVETAKDPAAYPIITYAWVLLLSCVGGAVNFIRKIREGHARPFNISELIGELVTAAFAGLMTFYLCEAAGIMGPLSAAFVGISGHMGSRAIFIMEEFFAKRIDAKITGGQS